jgi:hypothetical protein
MAPTGNVTSATKNPFMSSPYVPGGGLNAFTISMPPSVRPLALLSGSGSPDGVVEANPGTGYRDTVTNDLYVKFAGVQRVGWVNVGKCPASTGGGGGGDTQIFSCAGSPVGVIFPTATDALCFQTDSVPAGIMWSYYEGAWH